MKILINTTTFPNNADSPVPAFVLDQIKAMHAINTELDIDVLLPHHAYEKPLPDTRIRKTHREIRYHYFWPRSFEKLTGRGILPALKENPFRAALIPFHLYFQYRALKALCRRNRPDVVYAHWFMSPAIISYFACKPFDIPLIFTTHASDVSVLKKVPFSKNLIRKVLNYCSAYTAVSHRTKSRLTDFFSEDEWFENFEDKLSIIPMGTHLNGNWQEDSYAQLRQSIGLAPSQNYVLAMGRLAEKKGFTDLITAYGQLTGKEQSKYHLVIAGEGQLKQTLESQAKTLNHQGKIVFPGYVSGDLKAALLSGCDVFVMPSIIDSKGDSEGLPVTLMEALSQKRIVVATNVSGAEEVLTSETGYLVEQKSPTQISHALSQIFNLSPGAKKKIQSKAGELALKFDWPVIAQKHLNLLSVVTRS